MTPEEPCRVARTDVHPKLVLLTRASGVTNIVGYYHLPPPFCTYHLSGGPPSISGFSPSRAAPSAVSPWPLFAPELLGATPAPAPPPAAELPDGGGGERRAEASQLRGGTRQRQPPCRTAAHPPELSAAAAALAADP
eukprot:CAMPEP_0206152230 /NCGR_PEP_ID=MMETSP1473-20131121/39224_1 /ASSEMBLY_ACC=CAM_ASM_001109 /TAXON_ID=1461547 /ORGANISM="Stichococcus sp, Strain RCC1054" /LENGTH=136 /DNA_ID=CAMNT_0053549789 /DNA_START=474 /DNA_END=882 /DNA_ORIENTATION=-